MINFPTHPGCGNHVVVALHPAGSSRQPVQRKSKPRGSLELNPDLCQFNPDLSVTGIRNEQTSGGEDPSRLIHGGATLLLQQQDHHPFMVLGWGLVSSCTEEGHTSPGTHISSPGPAGNLEAAVSCTYCTHCGHCTWSSFPWGNIPHETPPVWAIPPILGLQHTQNTP